MSQQDILTQLQFWFTDRTGSDFDIHSRYLEAENFDSFDVIDLVAHVEKNWDIKFSAADFQSQDFNSIAGLAKLIDARVKA